MATAFLLVGLLWLYLSLALSFTAGTDRKRRREELLDFWRKSAGYVFPFDYLVRAWFCGAYALWLLPATRPGWGIAGGLLMLLLSAVAT